MVSYGRWQNRSIFRSYRFYNFSQTALRSVKRRDRRYDAIYAQAFDLTAIYAGCHFDLCV